ncbi:MULTISPECIES: ABC transporter ATP-binding protein [unclassified Pseudoxanthomonas]|uniref:ABC transporter ATP-binding protein n=1 Tax=unclassified Pseudoxanthomonas TaxID=2645906 RepID=UPI00161E1502|nr:MULTISPECIES: ABC transporter ATP-binding protein [unclassified Pseudoxanthomonas]MBB3277997.1 ATP-binding cassette subfamily B multidrug efflux pump [Pseudoxanthomonas sp. OG2]MBD9375775.1 ABC transporter ATP-binding protein [Pseudoxanthomonas sp. PXM04]MBV7474666.1 ABC transporter ATP-binding protein/permease [Pseudoxanthomonas sp. PXM05]
MFRFFEKRIDPYPAGEPATPPRKLFAFLLHYSRPLLPWLLLMSVLTGAISALEILFFDFMGDLVDWLGSADRASFLSTHGSTLLWMGTLVVVVYPLLVLVQSLVIHQTIFGNYPMIARWLSHRYLLRQSVSFFQDEFAGRISQKVMQTALAIRETVMKLMDVFVYVAVYFVGTVILVGRADLRLILPLALWLVGYLVILFWFVPRLQRVSMAQSDARAQMTGRIVDSYTNIQTIKLFAHTMREQDYARDAMDEFMVTVHRQMRLVTQLTVSLHSINALLLAGVGGLAVMAWLQGSISLGAIAVAIALVMRIRSMSDWILWEVASLFENIGTVEDGMNTIAQPLAITDGDGARDLEVSRGEIRFEHLQFQYGRTSKVIEDLSLVIRPGEKVGIVGRSGAGKSTLVNLLLRFYDLEGGRILIDGQDIARVRQESLRRNIGMVTQDTSLLHRSIRDNIRYGRPDADEAQIVEASRRAHADEFIRTLTDAKGRSGYDTHVGERGVKLSGGQRQRVAIARVLLKDAPILVLDEATSALDSEVEAAIQEQLYALMEGKTVIAIAHRLSTIAVLDRLVVMDQGRIIETGSHDELLQRDGLYAALWRRQSGGFIGLDVAEVG